MNVKPVLGSWEIPHIAEINALERRSYVELPVPGRVGSLFQDMNTKPARIAIAGSLYGDEDRNEFLEEVRAKFYAGEPLTFVGDIITATEIQYVVIETLLFEQNGARPDETSYLIVLKESPPPPPPPDPLGGLDAGLLDQAGSLLDSVAGALDLISGLGDIPDFGDPTEPVTRAMDGIEAATQGLGSIVDSLEGLFGA
jgi:hypothetical protein